MSLSPTTTGEVTFRARTNEGIRLILGVDTRYQVVDPLAAVVLHPHAATRLIDDLERIIHTEVSKASLSELLEDREPLTMRLQAALSARTLTWGLQVLRVELRTAEAQLDRELLRSMHVADLDLTGPAPCRASNDGLSAKRRTPGSLPDRR